MMAACAVLGLFAGSYAGVVIDRVPRGEPSATGRSHCDSCGRQLRWHELVPVLSWLASGGRCRTCRAGVSGMSTVVELATAGLFAAMAVRFGAHWELGGFLVLVAALVMLTAIDRRTRTLPRSIIYYAAACGAPFLVVGAVIDDDPARLLSAVLGATGALAFFLVIYARWDGAMGDGDVRLATLLGLYLGWIGPLHTAVGLFLGFLTGAVVGVVVIAAGRGGRRTAIPFGPFLALGSTVAVLFGDPIIDTWLRR